MKLVRFGKAGEERLGIVDTDSKLRDASIIDDVSSLTLGTDAWKELLKLENVTTP